MTAVAAIERNLAAAVIAAAWRLDLMDPTKRDQLTAIARSHFKSGVLYYKKGDYGRAINEYTSAIQFTPTYADAYVGRYREGRRTAGILDVRDTRPHRD
jgi:hypothetical protein